MNKNITLTNRYSAKCMTYEMIHFVSKMLSICRHCS